MDREVASMKEWLQVQTEASDTQPICSPGLKGFSIAPEGDSSHGATLTSFDRPALDNSNWYIDDDFIGFTPLSDPFSANIDIISVPGLGEHALESFSSGDGVSVWLRDFAPKDVPRARWIAYGHDISGNGNDSSQGIRELAHTFLDRLDILRRETGTTERPLIFVCHSIGGIVLKEALVMASKASDSEYHHFDQIVKATHGMVMLGVPNLGLRSGQLPSVVEGQLSDLLVRDLVVRKHGEPSQFLDYITSEFARFDGVREPPFDIISYYETMTTAIASASEDGVVSMTGQRETIVTKSSAERIGHSIRDFKHLPSNTDHWDLVKFEHPQDNRYTSVIDKIKTMAIQATGEPLIQARTLRIYHDSSDGEPGQEYQQRFGFDASIEFHQLRDREAGAASCHADKAGGGQQSTAGALTTRKRDDH